MLGLRVEGKVENDVDRYCNAFEAAQNLVHGYLVLKLGEIIHH